MGQYNYNRRDALLINYSCINATSAFGLMLKVALSEFVAKTSRGRRLHPGEQEFGKFPEVGRESNWLVVR